MKKTLLRTTSVLAILASMAVAHESFSSPGAVDVSWGAAGSRSLNPLATGSSETFVSDLVLQADGKLLVIGQQTINSGNEIFVLRLTAVGQIDSGYGAAGIARIDLGTGSEAAEKGVLQPDGSLLIVGRRGVTGSDNIVVRLTPTGNLDGTFGLAGKVDSARVGGYRIALQSDAGIVVGGATVVSRLLPTGTFDTTFSGDGSVQAPQSIWPLAMAIDADASTVIAGEYKVSGLNAPWSNVRVGRLTNAGVMDTAFGTNGVRDVPMPSGVQDPFVMSLAIDPAGRILVSAQVKFSGGGGVLLTRLLKNGDLDASFGTAGFVTTAQTEGLVGGSLAIQPDGRILLAYNGDQTGQLKELIVTRYLPDGATDPTFGTGGTVARDLDSSVTGAVYGGRPNPLVVDPRGVIYSYGFWGSGGGPFATVTTLLALDANNDGASEPWDVQPSVLVFPTVLNASLYTPTPSALATVSGLGANVAIPIAAVSGELALNGETSYRPWGWVRNGDSVNLRRNSSPTPSTAVSMSARYGGLITSNNAAAALGTVLTSSFSITTAAGVPGTLGFLNTTLTANESAGSVLLTVTRTGGSIGTVSLNYATVSNTAQAGSEFTATTGVLTWADSDSSSRSIVIPILNDSVNEASKSFGVSLTGPTGGATIGNAVATVTIADDDPVSTQTPTTTPAPTTPTTTPAPTSPSSPPASSSGGGGAFRFGEILAMLCIVLVAKIKRTPTQWSSKY